jgi:hypothetical protein
MSVASAGSPQAARKPTDINKDTIAGATVTGDFRQWITTLLL